MHGDDAGSSARVVWVVHPSRVKLDEGYTQKFGELDLDFKLQSV